MMEGGSTMLALRARTGRGAVGARGSVAARAIALRSDEDLAGIRRAGAVVAAALEAARLACRAGITTAELDRAAREVMTSAGAEPIFLGYRGAAHARDESRPAFPAATCISINDELVHGVPGARIVRQGDLVSIDAGVRLDGWCAHAAITVCVGEVGSSRRALVDAATRALDHAIARIAPGRRWSTIAAEIESIAVDAGFTVAVDFVGHGIGRELHEAPQVPCSVYGSFLERGDFTLRPGMVLAIEPMFVDEAPRRSHEGELLGPKVTLASDGWTVVVDSGAASCQVEHTVAVTRDGAEILTRLHSSAGMNAADSHARPSLRRAG